MEEEYYEEVPTEEYEDEDITGSDMAFILGGVILACLVFTLVMVMIKKTFKNVHLKVGNKFELGVETKNDKDISERN